jgi:hypothetical protein
MPEKVPSDILYIYIKHDRTNLPVHLKVMLYSSDEHRAINYNLEDVQKKCTSIKDNKLEYVDNTETIMEEIDQLDSTLKCCNNQKRVFLINAFHVKWDNKLHVKYCINIDLLKATLNVSDDYDIVDVNCSTTAVSYKEKPSPEDIALGVTYDESINTITFP